MAIITGRPFSALPSVSSLPSTALIPIVDLTQPTSLSNETITFGNKQRDVYVFKSHPDPLTKYFEIWEFDSQTGVLMLFKQGGVQNGETWELEEKLTDTNIFDYPTKIDSIKQ